MLKTTSSNLKYTFILSQKTDKVSTVFFIFIAFINTPRPMCIGRGASVFCLFVDFQLAYDFAKAGFVEDNGCGIERMCFFHRTFDDGVDVRLLNLRKSRWDVHTRVHRFDFRNEFHGFVRFACPCDTCNICKAGAVRNYLVFLMVLLNYAKRCGYVQFRVDPFFGYELPKMEVRQSWISVDEVRTIRDLKTTKPNLQKCRDLFMLSYYLGGINMTDLLDINFDEHSEVIHYIRKKTENRPKLNKFVEFSIPDEAKPIIAKWKGPDGKLAVTKYQRKDGLHCFFDTNMSKLAEATGIKNLIYYSARKSFSQHAFDLGISTSVIDYILGHRVDKGGTSLYNYISVTPEIATEAVRKVLDNLK